MPDQPTEAADLTQLERQALAGRVAREMAHDINDLLVGVISVAQEALSADRATERREALETVTRYGQKIADLVRAFQVPFSGADARWQGVPVDVVTTLDHALSLCQKRVRNKSIEVRQDYRSLPRVQAGIGLLEQVFLELLHAALDATPSQGTLALTVEEGREWATVIVSCEAGAPTGMTVPKTDSRSQPPDAGDATKGCCDPTSEEGREGEPAAPDAAGTPRLGLAVARTTVRQFGGELDVECTLGKRFRSEVRLPILPTETVGPPPTSETS